MGRKGSWFSSVKKVLYGSDSRKQQKQKQKQKHHKSKLGCFGYHEASEFASEEAAIAVVPSLPRIKEVKPIEAENEQSKQAFSLVLATAVAAGAVVAAAAEVARLNIASPVSRYPGKTKEEIAAIKIQTVFRGYLARRSLRAMRGLARLKTLIQSQSVKRQAATTLQCMQTFSKLQTQIRARRIRMSEENQALQRQLQQKNEKELEKLQADHVGEKWDDSVKSKEQIEAKLLNRQIAAMRREKALAYASTHQQTWRNSSKSAANATFMDPNDPHWGWNWLERWMASRPWEGQSTMQLNDHATTKSASSHTMSVSEITKLYSLRDQNHDHSKNSSPTSQKASRLRSHNNSPSALATNSKASPYGKAKASSSPKGSSWGGGGDDSRSMFSINNESNRRHSIAISPVRDDESLASSPAFANHTASIKVAKARSKVGVHSNNGTPEKGASVFAKKRLSLSASPASSRRLSVPSKVGMVSNKSVAHATIREEKENVKVRRG